MARIPEREVERLKSEVSLARLVESHGIVLTRHGADLLGLCPFHDDHDPSLVISPKKNLWHCLGACQTGGSVIDWVMRLEGVSFRHAVELLREGIQPLAAETASPPRVIKQSTVPKLPTPVVSDADDTALLSQVIDYYHATLKQSPEALTYLQKRGLNHPDVIDHFKLGFANRTLGLRLPDKNRKAGAEIRTRLEQLGVIRESGHEHFNGSLVIPVIDAQGQVTEVYGRKITDNLRPGTPQHLYLPGPHRGVWNIAALAASKEIILCESLIDALTFWCAGYRHVTTSYGIEGFTAEHLVAFKHYGTERVLIAYDRDDAGDKAATALAEKLLSEGLECYRVLLALEQLQEQALSRALQPSAPVLPDMSEPERDAALALLKDPNLIARIVADFETCGLIGERTNKLIGYLAAVSRQLDRPLGVVVQSSSAAGKSALLDAVLAFMPDEAKVKYSAMTGQSLFYMGETNLKHKVLAIVEEEGASRASYALKLLQSEGELTIASTGKDADTGYLVTQQYRVEGPVALLLTTTARDLDEELLNRCLVLTVDESRTQTQAIHQQQRTRRTLEGLVAKREREAVLTLHQNAQRLLRPLDVLNPYAAYLTFPDQTTRLRRDHEKYLTLIDTLALLHQHQRQVKTVQRGGQTLEYVEVTLDDIALANTLAHEVLGRSLDELPPQTRRVLRDIDRHVTCECARLACKRADYRFSRRALREALGVGDTQLKVHLARLTELEYVLAHRARNGSFDYELVYETNDLEDTARFPGLIDIETLKHAYDENRSGLNASRSAPGRRVVGVMKSLRTQTLRDLSPIHL